ncbi:unnamed protein product [Calicophoron daubneyi]|uniref:K Homology domain-containing protein n=1 Tax=Calicophoron daubneyi TaxID=300641 RepID=A0AAV2TP01_CALDB
MENDNIENNNLDSMLVHKATPEYLQDLLKDKKQLQNFPNIFLHLEIILEKEIARVREKLFHLNESFRKTENELPEPSGPITTLQEKVFVPVKENPNYNFVGRLLGPRGLTAKQLEQDLECKIMVRGRGSLRDKKKEDMNRGKPNWEHLDEELHVLVSVEDFENRAKIKLRRATETIRTFLEQGVRTPENEDRLKQLQLMELAVLNDKDRQQAHAQQMQQHQQLILQHQSLTVLNNQAAAAAAAAAAAQFLQPNAYQTNTLLARLQTTQSALNSPCLPYPNQATGLPSLPSSMAAINSSSSTPIGQSVTSTSNSLASYLSNPVLSNVFCPLSAGASAAIPGVSGVGSTGQLGLGLPLSSLSGATAGMSLPGFTFPMAPAVPNPVSPNLISCTPGPAQDQLTAMAAALLNGGSAAGQTISLSNGKVTVQESDSLKMRNVSGSVSQNRMHPYLRQ